jgi:hypothetical protein
VVFFYLFASAKRKHTQSFTTQKKFTNTPFFKEKTKNNFQFGIGKREVINTITNTSNQKQYFINLNLSHNSFINTKKAST